MGRAGRGRDQILPEPFATSHRTACPLDCPDACSLEVTVTGGRVTGINGTRLNPLTDGFICGKVRRFAEHVYGPERVRTPLVRRGAKGSGTFARTSWDDALESVATVIRGAVARHGGESILPFSYGGSNGYVTQDSLDARLFRRLAASRRARTVCAAATTAAAAALYGRMPGVPLSDYVHAKLIVIWGQNPSATSIHFVPIVKEARRRGAKLVVIDPRRTPLAGKADLHLAVRPGTDLPVALSVIRWLFDSGNADDAFLSAHASGVEDLRERASQWTFERAAGVAGVEATDLAAFARLYAEASPAAIRCGWGPERNRNGGSAIASILALPAVAGKFGLRGGGYTLSNSGAWPMRGDAAACEPERPTRVVNMNRLGEALTEIDNPPVTVLFVYNCNPLATMPNQEKVRKGLERADLFTIVFDQVMTDTARYADLVLPATTFLEHDELSRGYGAMVLNRIHPVIAPEGEARSNPEVFGALCRALGLSRPGEPETAEEIADAVLRDHPDEAALRSALDRDGIAEPPALSNGTKVVQFGNIFPATSDRKVHLFPEALDAEAPEGLYRFRPDPATPRHPLALISPAMSRATSSTLAQLERREAALAMHPDDATERGIAEGDEVRVFNDLGEVRCAATISRDLRPGVVHLPKGLWSGHTRSGTTANALCPDSLTDFAGGACFNDARVDVERAGS